MAEKRYFVVALEMVPSDLYDHTVEEFLHNAIEDHLNTLPRDDLFTHVVTGIGVQTATWKTEEQKS